MAQDTDRHGPWSNKDQRYEDGTESHMCGKWCAVPEETKKKTNSDWVDTIICG